MSVAVTVRVLALREDHSVDLLLAVITPPRTDSHDSLAQRANVIEKSTENPGQGRRRSDQLREFVEDE
jgi:hypothetical protein